MDKYCVAADFKKETIDAYAELNNRFSTKARVIETYGQMTIGNSMTGGRVCHDIPKIYFDKLRDYVEYSESRNIAFNYSLNGFCMGNKEFTSSGLSEIYCFIKSLYHIGIRSITVSSIAIMEMIRTKFPDIEIKISIINQVNTVNKLEQYLKLGADRIVVDEGINRDFPLLKKLAGMAKIELIVNSLCAEDCIYRGHHYNQTAHASLIDDEQILTYYNHRCMLYRSSQAENILKLCWIRPEDIHYYREAGIRYFKIQGRHTASMGHPVEAVKCYMEESYNGNLIDLLELFNCPYNFKVSLDNKRLDRFILPFTQASFCHSDCGNCSYCKDFLQANFETVDFQKMNDLAKRYYGDMDEFKWNLDKIENNCMNAEETFEWNGIDLEQS